MIWNVHPEAQTELEEATEYYAALGSLQVAQFDAARRRVLDLLETWPELGSPYLEIDNDPPIRRHSLGKFPYSVYYVENGAELVILAYAHHSRKPEYWRERMAYIAES